MLSLRTVLSKAFYLTHWRPVVTVPIVAFFVTLIWEGLQQGWTSGAATQALKYALLGAVVTFAVDFLLNLVQAGYAKGIEDATASAPNVQLAGKPEAKKVSWLGDCGGTITLSFENQARGEITKPNTAEHVNGKIRLKGSAETIAGVWANVPINKGNERCEIPADGTIAKMAVEIKIYKGQVLLGKGPTLLAEPGEFPMYLTLNGSNLQPKKFEFKVTATKDGFFDIDLIEDAKASPLCQD